MNDNPEGPVGYLNPTHTIFGFGSHGFERTDVGPGLAGCVSVLQGHLRREMERMI